MKRDQVFRVTAARTKDFEFNEEVARVLDDMFVRSIPLYLEQQSMIRDIARKFWLAGSDVYDLGCSTATTLLNLSQAIPGPARLIGYDNSLPVLDQAKKKIKKSKLENRIEVAYADLNGQLDEIPFGNASVVTMCWTLQFIRPLNRDRLIKWIYDGMVENGVLLVTEKILTDDSNMNRFFIDFYYDFKKRNNYSTTEIQGKREALENVLIPYRAEENLQVFRRNGFEIVETFFQWYNFAGFLCMKTPKLRS